TVHAEFHAALAKAEALYGPTDLLINNAGMMLLGQIDTQPAEEFKTMFDINVIALLNGMQAVLAPMKARNTGTIINISSVAGRKTFGAHAAYCGTNVRVITIAPGAVETELLSHTTSEDIKAGYEEWKKTMGNILAPDDVARSIEFAYAQPQDVCIREIVLASTRQEP
ncbi:SDR family oxidoreductase, partial [Moritella sp.]|uniref:SDR family oxidoreductase n=1 Tax=Moritella sp. TaxID=78556 RepID=UPI0025DCD6D5